MHPLHFGRPLVIQGHFLGSRSVIQPRGNGTAFPLPAGFDLGAGRPGQPLPPAVQRKMESVFGASFADVRVHVGPQAAAIGAMAFTFGSSIYFAPGQYEPHGPHGQRLLGHELTHVVQQRSGRVRNPFGSGVAVVQDPGLEAEAERMSLRVLDGGGAAAPGGLHRLSAGPAVQCRGYDDSAIRAFLGKQAQDDDETRGAYVKRITGLFKTQFQYHDRTDLNFMRDEAWGARGHLAPYPTHIVRPLHADFNAHVLGNQAGVGWHSESVNEDGDPGYSYANRQNLATTKGTYFADTVVINHTAKAGNNGRSTFFPANMTIGTIRYEATYVANRNAPAGQICRGRGPYTGIMIDCLLNGGQVVSAYPYKPGW